MLIFNLQVDINKKQETMDRNATSEEVKAQMLELLKANDGNVSDACEQLHISRQTHYNWMNNDADYAKAFDEINEANIDFAEKQLRKSIKEGDITSIIFFLKTKGKNRGFSERVEQKIEAKTEISGTNIDITRLPEELVFKIVEALNGGNEDNE